MQFNPGPLDGLIIIEPDVFGDDRGYFYEAYKASVYKNAGISEEFVQDNVSLSLKNTVRGLHFQKPPFAQSKLVRVLAGEVYDIAVDIRQNSPTFGQWFGIYLSEDNKKSMYIPTGFAHGFAVTTDVAVFYYQCGAEYNKESESGIRWDDSELKIDWPVDRTQVIVSDKDQQLLDFNRLKDNKY